MNKEIPSVISAFFLAHNTGQTSDFSELFTADAVVADEGHAHRGRAIKAWIDGSIAKYKPIATVTDLVEEGIQIIVTAQVSGTFPGSPTQLRYTFTLTHGKISALRIGI